jgi:NADPH2:quinone reductase
MLALRFETTGSLDRLVVRDLPKPVPISDDVLIQVKAAAVNPSDIGNVLHGMKETTLPRTPGRDFSGIVVDGPAKWIGKTVFGSGGNLGFGRDGSHAEFVLVPENAILPMPKGLTFEQSAAVGVAYMTAWAALIKVAKLQRGEVVLIPGTAGAVGSAAARIAHKAGARVIGTVRNAAGLAGVRDLPVDTWIDLEIEELSNGVRKATAGKGVEVVFDLVGGSLFGNCLASLAWRGRQVAISSRSEPKVSFNLTDFYHNESRLLGLDSLKFSFEEAAQILLELTPGFESGEFPPPEVQAFPLAKGPEVYREINESRLKGKVVLVP